MKKLILALVAVAALTFGFASPAQAAPPRGVSLYYNTHGTAEDPNQTVSYSVRNTGTLNQTIVLEYNTEDGSILQTAPIVIEPGSELVVYGLTLVEGNGVVLSATLLTVSGSKLDAIRVRDSR